jgi:16S rRNA (uracil1498-N3)-methyltransferase
MPTTPAWPPKSLPRLFVEQRLSEGVVLTLEGTAANYLAAVLRLGPGAGVKLFDDRSGEWLAEVRDAGKRKVVLAVTQRLRPREAVPDLWLLFAPLKRGRIDWMVEKATEMGAARLVPILTQRTIVDKLNVERLRAHMIEAAEQCERTALPALAEPAKLKVALRDWPESRTLYFADESGGAPIGDAVVPGRAAILIGPEGGFTNEEAAAIRAVPGSKPVSLGPRILRADTAAVAALAVWMAQAGDWTEHADR